MLCRVALGTQIVEQRINSGVYAAQRYAAQHSYVPLLSLRRDSPSKIVPDFLGATL